MHKYISPTTIPSIQKQSTKCTCTLYPIVWQGPHFRGSVLLAKETRTQGARGWDKARGVERLEKLITEAGLLSLQMESRSIQIMTISGGAMELKTQWVTLDRLYAGVCMEEYWRGSRTA